MTLVPNWSLCAVGPNSHRITAMNVGITGGLERFMPEKIDIIGLMADRLSAECATPRL
jgi:hypothetical protein